MKDKITRNYPRLRPSEQKVAEYFLNKSIKVEDLKLAYLEREIGVSQPTIVRFVKKLGYESFKQFQADLIRMEVGEQVRTTEGFLGYKIAKEDSLEEIPGKLMSASIKQLEETLKCMDLKQYKKAVNAIKEAAIISLFSVENSHAVTKDLYTKLSYIGKRCLLAEDYYLQNIQAQNLTKTDVAIAISYSGYSEDVVEILKIARKRGATTIVITNVQDSKVCEDAEIVLYASDEQFLYGSTIFSRLSQIAIVDMLYVGVLNSDYDTYAGILARNSKSISEKSYKEESV